VIFRKVEGVVLIKSRFETKPMVSCASGYKKGRDNMKCDITEDGSVIRMNSKFETKPKVSCALGYKRGRDIAKSDITER
jgi:hypothetical protein